jgi:hypothetical protein
MDVSEREKFCAPVDVQSGEVEGGVQFELPVEPCREVDYRWGPAESPADEVVRLIAIGTVDDLATIEAIVEETSSESPRPSMYVLLGDQLPEASSEGITSYRAFLGGLQVPTVVAAGERALADDEGAKFRRTFGPTDFLFDVGSTHVMVFASIDQTLGVRGMSRLENFARALPDDGIRVAVTHSPPLAMAGLEEQAFRSRLEGARVLSVLSEQGVDVLLAGHALSTAREEQAGIEVFVTSSRDTAFGADGRYLDLRLRPGGEAPIEGRFRELP